MKFIVKSLRIIQKFFYLIVHDGFIITSTKLVKRYREGGRKLLTKSINIRYKMILKNNNQLLYKKWINVVESPNRLKAKIFFYEPLISIVMPTYNTPLQWLKEAIESVLNQNYKNWELCIADDASNSKEVLILLKKYQEKYSNIKVIYRLNNGNISEASNTALALARGEFITFLDHDDRLPFNALVEVVSVLNHYPHVKLIYSDEDKIDEENIRFDPHFKSDWNPDMFFSQNYLSHLTVIKKEIIDKSEKFRIGYEGAQDYDLFLQCIKLIKEDEIYHISKILYHWRAIDGSTAKGSSEKEYTSDAGLKALKDYFKNNVNSGVEKGLLPNTYRVNYKIIKNPLVSIIIPTKDNLKLLSTCVDSILDKTEYTNYEIIIIDNQTSDEETLLYLNELSYHPKIKILQYNKAFNYAAINNYAVHHASGEYLAFLNNDIEVITKNWLNNMLEHAQREEIGIVGAKLYYEDNSIQHGGVILGIGGIAGHAHKYFNKDEHGYFSRLKIIQNYSALTAATIVMKKSIFEEVNGFEEKLAVAFNDIDLSLKVLEKGYRNLWTPYAELIHYESKSRGHENTVEKKARFDKEILFMKEKWGVKLLDDRCYNKNLTLEHEDFSLKIEEKY
jgi:glycosyltransferase involved in cell wall biosynthesis